MAAPLLTLGQAVDDCEIRILAAASRTRADVREAVTYAHGIAHGYFMAGAASDAEYHVATDRIRDIGIQAERQFEALSEAA